MANYYFLASLLPEIAIGASAEITFQELDHLLHDNLTHADYRQVIVLRRYFDLLNIRNLWLKDKFEPYGNLNPLELEDALVTGIGLPSYVMAYLDKYPAQVDRLQHFPELERAYFEHEIPYVHGVLRELLILHKDMRIILAALRARELNRDLLAELQYENPDDPIVAHIIAQKDAPEFEPPEKYDALKGLYQGHKHHPMELHQALVGYQYETLENAPGVDFFSIERILAYLYQLILVEKWQSLDAKKGTQMIDHIVKDVV
jgi:hypothetical protein